MKAKIIATGKVYEAKYFEDLTEEELKNTVETPKMWKGKDLFLEPSSWNDERAENHWRYMFDNEVEIISEVSE